MLIQLNDKYRVVSNDAGGYNLEEADIDQKTGKIRIRNGKPVWVFRWFMPTLDKMLKMFVEELTPVANPILEGVKQIIDTIEAEYEKVRIAIDKLS